MKRLAIGLLIILALASGVAAQSLCTSCTQIIAPIIEAKFRLILPHGSTPPASGSTPGALWYDTDDFTIYAWDGDSWEVASGAGGDAGTLDGLDSLQFLRSDVSDTFEGVALTLDNVISSQPALVLTQEMASVSDAAGTVFNWTNQGAGILTLQVDGSTVWHAGNDGAGSTLDADLLDGISSGSFLRGDTANSFNANSFQSVSLENTDAGTAASIALQIRNTASINDALRLAVQGTGYTPAGGFEADSAVVSAETNLVGLNFLYRAALGSGYFKWWGGTSTLLAQLDGAGLKLMEDPLTLPEIATPATPGTGGYSTYAKSDGKLYGLNDAGVEKPLGAGMTVLSAGTTTVGNVGTGEDDLQTYSLAAGHLNADGDVLEIEAAGAFGATANAKILRLYFGATAIFTSPSTAWNTKDWRVHCQVVRTGAATQRSWCEFATDDTTSAATATDTDYTTPGETLSGAVTIKATGQGTANDDVTNTMLVVRSGNSASQSDGPWRHVATATVSGSAATSFSVSGLDLDADGEYRLICEFKNATTSTATISLYYNSDTTAGNYRSQFLTAAGSTVTGSGGSTAGFAALLNATTADNFVVADVADDPSGTTRANILANRDNTAGALIVSAAAHLWTSTANVTSMAWNSDVANSLDVGSQCQVFALKE